MKACGRCCLAPGVLHTSHKTVHSHRRGHSSTIDGALPCGQQEWASIPPQQNAQRHAPSRQACSPRHRTALRRSVGVVHPAFLPSQSPVRLHPTQVTTRRGGETAAATPAAPLKTGSTNAWHLFAAACHLARRMWVSRSPTLRARARMASVPSCLVSACCVSATDCTVFWRATKSARTQRTNERNARERRHKQLQPLRSAKTPHPWQA